MCVCVKTLGNTNTDSAPCALIKKTIKNDHKPVFSSFLPLLRRGFPQLALQLEPERRGQPAACQNEESASNTGDVCAALWASDGD